MPVTTGNFSKDESAFLSSDKKALYLPTDMPAFQLDFTQYYYPGPVGSPGKTKTVLWKWGNMALKYKLLQSTLQLLLFWLTHWLS